MTFVKIVKVDNTEIQSHKKCQKGKCQPTVCKKGLINGDGVNSTTLLLTIEENALVFSKYLFIYLTKIEQCILNCERENRKLKKKKK